YAIASPCPPGTTVPPLPPWPAMPRPCGSCAGSSSRNFPNRCGRCAPAWRPMTPPPPAPSCTGSRAAADSSAPSPWPGRRGACMTTPPIPAIAASSKDGRASSSPAEAARPGAMAVGVSCAIVKTGPAPANGPSRRRLQGGGSSHPMERRDDITRLLVLGRAGDAESRDQAIELLYGELQAIALRLLRREREMLTLGALELVHDAFLRLFGDREPDWESRRQLLGCAAPTLRQVLVSMARKRNADKRPHDAD